MIEFTISYVLVLGMPPTIFDCVQYSINATRLPSNKIRLRGRGDCYYMVRVNWSRLIGRQASILMGEKGDHSCCVRRVRMDQVNNKVVHVGRWTLARWSSFWWRNSYNPPGTAPDLVLNRHYSRVAGALTFI